jgi:hypothetical protein
VRDERRVLTRARAPAVWLYTKGGGLLLGWKRVGRSGWVRFFGSRGSALRGARAGERSRLRRGGEEEGEAMGSSSSTTPARRGAHLRAER